MIEWAKIARVDSALKALEAAGVTLERVTAYADIKRAQVFQADGEKLSATVVRLYDQDEEFFNTVETILLAIEEYGLE